MSSNVLRSFSGVLSSAFLALLLAGCGASEVKMSGALGDDPFVRVARTSQALTVDAGADGYASNENFYIAINKSQLGSKWFLSAYLTQWHPAEAGLAAQSLGTRVVTFKVQNGKLYVFDATDGAKWSDALDPTRVVEAFPIVTDYAPFNSTAGSSNFVLFDPAAGLNRFEMMSDSFAAAFSARFEIEVSYLQRFRALSDGVAYDQVFAGYTEVPGPGVLGFDQPFRGQGTMSISLRRYSEGAGFVASELQDNHYFGSNNVQYVPNEPRAKRNVVKWNIKPGMQPIPWRIGQTIARLRADPRLAGVDLEGAIARGITGWNEAFGFPVFSVVPTGAADSFGDDDKNFIIIDNNPGMGRAFANWRENPNTGEIRGASVYFSTVFVEAALQSASEADAGQQPVVDAGQPAVDAGADAGIDAGQPDAGSDAGTTIVPCAPSLSIAQVFGGNSATGFRNQDFVMIHNRTSAPVQLAGMSLQYGSATGTAAWQVIPLSGQVPANGSYLVGLAATDGGVSIPNPDVSSGINLSASNGKVALVQNTIALTGACALTSAVIDVVGYGTTNCSELRAAPSPGTASTVIRRDQIGCVDSNDNLADFTLATLEPKNTAAAPSAPCVCTASSAPLPELPPFFTSTSTDGGVNMLPPPSTAMLPQLRWGSMSEQSVCAFEAPSRATIPAGMTRKEFLEKYITETILHEVGHTLGLRHNFKGSFEESSVMDYNPESLAVRLDHPGAYDVAAVRFLYGLSPTAPTLAFCTDEDTQVDAQCDRFDSTTNPLINELAPRYQRQLREALAERAGFTYGQIFPLTRYVRGAANEQQRLDAFNALMGDVAPPLKPEVIALGPNAAAWANVLNASLLSNLFVQPAMYRDEIGVNPLLNDAVFRARVIEVAKNTLLSSDGYRSFDTMRVMVDVLKAMQHGDALIALTECRATFASARNNYPAATQPCIDDLIRRMDLAMSPYFY